MYQLDLNTNTALEGQADRIRAVNAYGADQTPPAATLRRPLYSRPVQAALALAVAAPAVMLIAWGVLAR